MIRRASPATAASCYERMLFAEVACRQEAEARADAAERQVAALTARAEELTGRLLAAGEGDTMFEPRK